MTTIIKPGSIDEIEAKLMPLRASVHRLYAGKSPELLMMEGWRLSLAKVVYYMPDHPSLLNEFTWQELDLEPRFPRLQIFLNFWKDNIDATIQEVFLATGARLKPGHYRSASHYETLN
jgi:uncharacterized protein Usg